MLEIYHNVCKERTPEEWADEGHPGCAALLTTLRSLSVQVSLFAFSTYEGETNPCIVYQKADGTLDYTDVSLVRGFE